jgi:hypothetical protein
MVRFLARPVDHALLVRLLTEGGIFDHAVREESDAVPVKSGTVFAGAPPMSAEQLVTRGLINHGDEHFGSIRKTIGG